ncbi:hypothetical protein OPIT5_20180 [Opitutaceae bacterium TAV5]|nr:hypothetical protein OPIT5_20180 [Opitutaceae bacterium TAV5]
MRNVVETIRKTLSRYSDFDRGIVLIFRRDYACSGILQDVRNRKSGVIDRVGEEPGKALLADKGFSAEIVPLGWRRIQPAMIDCGE